MNKIIYILIILIAAIIFGFVSAQFVGGGVTSCTLMACICEQEGELPCNSCSSEELIFTTGVINVAKVCNAREILICRKNEQITRRYEATDDCKIKVKFFDFVLDYTK